MRGGEGEELGDEKMEEVEKEMSVFMWGYLPGVSPQRSPLLVPTVARLSLSVEGDAWRDVCGGGCGFAMAISGTYSLIVLAFCVVDNYL